MPTQKTVTVYKFNELSDSARKRVLDKAIQHFEFYSDHVIDEFNMCLQDLGFFEVNCAFTGFWSQGDGASFTGYFNSQYLKEPNTDDSPEIREIYEEINKLCGSWSICFEVIRTNSRYVHERSTKIEDFNVTKLNACSFAPEKIYNEKLEKIKNIVFILNKILYKKLEKEFEFQMSEGQITQQLIDLDHDYLENGKIFLH